LHLHLCLNHKDPGNFGDKKQPEQTSQEIGHFIAGVLAHARANTAITNPLINSYKRLVPNSLTMPVNVAWSEETRNTVLRVVSHKEPELRVEVRNPDPACNPYLALAVILKAGLEGIRQKLPQPPPLAENIIEFDENKTQSARVDCLPHTLGEALQELASDQLARSTLGEYIYQRFARVKAEEWERFQTFVHPWELQEYLSRF
jgi:glutamine synthetase